MILVKFDVWTMPAQQAPCPQETLPHPAVTPPQGRLSLNAKDCLENYSERSFLYYAGKKNTTKPDGSRYNLPAD